MRHSIPHSSRTRAWTWLSVACAICLSLAACDLPYGGMNSAPPPGWTDITPPDTRQDAVYAVSPDIPGLIIAIIGGYSQTSAGAPPIAQLWRTTNGGANWRPLDNLSVRAGTQLVMPPGGHGLVFADDPLGNNIFVSKDSGASWRTLPAMSTSDTAENDEWAWLSGAVAIGSHLYAGGVAPGWSGLESGATGFSISDNDGFTWRPLETTPDSAGSGMITQAIAPLDASGATWLRLVARGGTLSPMGSDLTPRIAIERSTDGGVTWTALAQQPHIAGYLIGAQLSADPTHPGHVCASLTSNALSTPTGSASRGGAAILVHGSPPPRPLDISLFATSDRGASWRGDVTVKLRKVYGWAVAPGVRMSADGSCYLAIFQVDSIEGPPTGAKGTLWRLTPDASAAATVFTFFDRQLRGLFLAPGSSGAPERFIALTRISGPGDGETISCGQGCYTYRDAGIYRLIWEPAP